MTEQNTDSGNQIPEDVRYEELIEQLDVIVELLESGTLTLEDSVTQYERGMQLVKRCNELLDRAELRVTELGGSENVSRNLETE